jgi:hypothetical protein
MKQSAVTPGIPCKQVVSVWMVVSRFMKLRISVITALSLGLTGAALADSYDAWVAQGYRWVSAHGPYACTRMEGAQRVTTDRSDATELDMVVHGQAYYLIPGTIVQVVEENQTTGMSQVHMRGISPPLLGMVVRGAPVPRILE